MSFPQTVSDFAHDDLFQAVLVLIALDLILGVAASLKTKQFKLSWLAMFAQDDLLGKVIPWFAVYLASKYAPSVDVLGVDLDAIQKIVFAAVAVALGGSLLSSLKELGLPVPKPSALPNLLGGERAPPPEP